jgi:hypothetical protein
VNPTTRILKFTAISAEFIITTQRLQYAELDPSKPRGPVTNTAGLRGSLCVFGYDASVVGMVKIPDSVLLDMESGPFHFVALSRTNREQVDYSSTIDTGKDSSLQSTGKIKVTDGCQCPLSRTRELPGEEPEPCISEQLSRFPRMEATLPLLYRYSTVTVSNRSQPFHNLLPPKTTTHN